MFEYGSKAKFVYYLQATQILYWCRNQQYPSPCIHALFANIARPLTSSRYVNPCDPNHGTPQTKAKMQGGMGGFVSFEQAAGHGGKQTFSSLSLSLKRTTRAFH